MAAIRQINVQVYASVEALPERWIAFLDGAAAQRFFHGIPWFRTILRTAGPDGDLPRIYAAESDGRPVAALIVRERRAAGRLKTHMLLSPSNGLYASIYGSLLDAELGPAGLREIVAAIVRASPSFDVLRFDCLDRNAPDYAVLAAAFRRALMLVRPFVSYHNFAADVEGLSIERYLAGRSHVMRDIIERDVRRLAESGRGRFELVTGGSGLKSALVDYALVDVQSWQDQEIYPDCIDETLAAASGAGALRLGLLYVDDEPAAAQIWIVGGGQATIWRARFAKKFTEHAVGAVLMYEMLRHVLAADLVREIDSGPGDDKTTQIWLDQRRERAGLLIFNPRTPKGITAAVGHIVGPRAMSAARRLRDGLRRLVARGSGVS